MKKLFLFLMLISINVLAETELKIITLQNRFANDLIPIIEPLVGYDGTVTGMSNQLIIRASPERLHDIEEAVARLDTARQNRKISINTNNNVQSQRRGVEASGRVGNVTINNGNASSTRRTSRTTRTLPNTGQVAIQNSSSNIRQSSNQFINVIDGERAFIRVGKIVPFTQEWITITQRYVQISRLTDWRDVTTGFAVRPRTVGNLVELEITPRIARLNNQGFIDFEELTTTINTTLGSWVDIAGTMQANDEVSRQILGVQNSFNQQNSGLSIKVD